MKDLSKNTVFLINISSISFILLNLYIIYSEFRFDLSDSHIARLFSILVSPAFAASTLVLIYKMISFKPNAADYAQIQYLKILLFYLTVIFYCVFIFFLKKDNLYFNLSIYTLVSIMAIFCLSHLFLLVKFHLRGNKNV
ncbi:hypothetical protein [Neisseria dentiae]|uniref:hypothetical protein n=1 Tax=Neisseria dentiae TaxID=194197 RepID=UPI00211BC498|nr:hypothetical protein [Neisseria dentiae]MCQ9327366.1 hypothetical protein [Neisseria dentiae]